MRVSSQGPRPGGYAFVVTAFCVFSVLFGGLLQAWFALDPQRFRALLPASSADLALVSGRVNLFQGEMGSGLVLAVCLFFQ